MEFITGVLVGVAAWPFFWVIFATLATILSVVVINEKGILSSALSLGVLVMLASKWQSILTNPFPLIAGVGGYLILGLLWSRFKWSRFLSEKFDKFQVAIQSFMKTGNLDKDKLLALKGSALEEYKNEVRNRSGERFAGEYSAKTVSEFNASLAPKAVTNKASIVMWIAYWPVTVFWYLCADIITDIGRGLYRMVGGHFQKMSTEKFNSL